MTDFEFTEKVNSYKNMVFRLAITYLKNVQNAEDVTQDVFIKLYQHDEDFQSKEYEKAWLIRVTINSSKDVLKSAWMKRTVPIVKDIVFNEKEESDLYYAIHKLKPKYRTAVHLYYYEDYFMCSHEEEPKGCRKGTDIGSSGISVAGIEVDGIEYIQTTSGGFRSIHNDKENNKLSLVYAAGIEASVDGKVRNVPGETYYLRIRDLDGEANFGDGLWEAEFTANYKETDSINLDVNKVAHMPKWGTDDEYVQEAEMMVNTVELSPLTLRYVCEYDKKFDLDAEEIQYWDQVYIVMEDGSIVAGRNTFDEYIDSIWEGTGLGTSGSAMNNGPWEYEAIFNEPIDITKVKEIHFGDLTIEVK